MDIVVGAGVFSADGQRLGTVKTVRESAFEVDAPHQFDYWLEATLAVRGDAERVDLAFPQSDLGGYKMDRPFDQDVFHNDVPEDLKPDAVRRSLLNP